MLMSIQPQNGPCEGRANRQALGWALLLGAFCRAVSAWVSLGFHGRDDYFHVLQPALLWRDHPDFDWQHSGLPGAGYRSHLLPRLVWLILCALRRLGIESPTGQLRGIYLTMGLLSLSLIPAMYLAARRYFDAATARRAAFVAALFFPFPYAGTRLLIEALAMPPLVLCLANCDSPRRSKALLAGASLGLACWWRLQVVTAGLGLILVLLLQRRRDPTSKPALGFFALGCGLCLLVQGMFDSLTAGQFFGPTWRNIVINLHPHAGLSRSAPWGYAGLLLALTLPPATPWLLPPLWRAAQRAWPVTGALGLFVLFHSLVPHKEDRFLLPVLPLYGLLLAAVPSMWQQTAQSSWLKRSWPVGRALACSVTSVLLLVAMTSQSQQNLRDTMALMRDDREAQGIISLGPEVQQFFLGRSDVRSRQNALPTEDWLLRSMAELAAEGAPPNRFVAYASDRQVTEVWLRLLGFACAAPARVEGWWFDRLLVRLNPRRNKRRGPTLLYRCQAPAVEVASVQPTEG